MTYRFWRGLAALAFLLFSANFSPASAQSTYRGMNTVASLTAAELEELVTLLAPKFIRYTIQFGVDADDDTVSEHSARVLAALDYFDANLLPILQREGMTVVIALGTPPGGFASRQPPYPQFRILASAEYQDALSTIWQTIATRYASNTTVVGYQIVNEPAVGAAPGAGLLDWYALQSLVASRIRAIDTQKAIVMSSEYSNPAKLSKITLPSGIGSVWYAIHVYTPTKFLRQGVELPALKSRWPGAVGTKKNLKKYLTRARKFAQKNNAQLFVSEFTTSRFAPAGSAARYLRDITTIFKSYGWHWTFHAWAEASAWDVRIPAAEDAEGTTLTARAAVLKSRFAE